jgi:hypothetical protein
VKPFSVIAKFNLPIETTGSIYGIQEFPKSSVLKFEAVNICLQILSREEPE